MSFRKVMHTVAWLACLAGAAVPCAAVTLLLGLEPGKSTRADANRVFGQPIRANADDLEYAPQSGTGPIVVRLRSGGVIIDAIQVRMVEPVQRAALASALRLADTPDGSRVAQDRLVDYYGSPNLLLLTHQNVDPASGIIRVDYASEDYFKIQATGLSLRSRTSETSVAVAASNAADAPVIMQFNPAACNDIYRAAAAENQIARATKNAARRQAILAVMLAAQKGDCASARTLFDTYNQRYKSPGAR